MDSANGRTEFLFRSDSYLNTVAAKVVEVNDLGGIVLDRTNFYATSGGQPGDIGFLEAADGGKIQIATTIHPNGEKHQIVHVPAEGQQLPSVGDEITCHIDWENRYKLMRVHTALHLLSVIIPLPVTGGAIGAEKGAWTFRCLNLQKTSKHLLMHSMT